MRLVLYFISYQVVYVQINHILNESLILQTLGYNEHYKIQYSYTFTFFVRSASHLFLLPPPSLGHTHNTMNTSQVSPTQKRLYDLHSQRPFSDKGWPKQRPFYQLLVRPHSLGNQVHQMLTCHSKIQIVTRRTNY